MLDDLSLLIVLHQMICLQVSSDTVILIYNQQTECMDGSTDRGVFSAGRRPFCAAYLQNTFPQLVLISIYTPH